MVRLWPSSPRFRPIYFIFYLVVGSTLLFIALTDKLEFEFQSKVSEGLDDDDIVAAFRSGSLEKLEPGHRIRFWLKRLHSLANTEGSRGRSQTPNSTEDQAQDKGIKSTEQGGGDSAAGAQGDQNIHQGSALWLGLSSENIRTINRGVLVKGQQRTVGSQKEGYPSHGLSDTVTNRKETRQMETSSSFEQAQENSRRPKWIEDLQRRDRQALISKLPDAKAYGIDDREPDEGTRRQARENLQSRIRTREMESREEITKWRTRGHPWPPPPASVPRPYSSGPDASSITHGDLGIIVLYVHKRVHYLTITLEALSRVQGISEMLLIVSHDGYFPEMDRAVKGITFCRVRQVYFPYSVHEFKDQYPAHSPGDCVGTEKEQDPNASCFGTADSFGHYRNASFVSLKHHWWWLMNTVWDSLPETQGYTGHILFMEEDHYFFPNVLLQLRGLIRAKQTQPRFSSCVSVHAAPANAASKGEAGLRVFVREKMGNIGYAFNRSIWDGIKRDHKAFCFFDDYNWDVSLSAGVLRFWPHSDSLRWSRTSAVHFGNCGGLHMLGIRRLGPIETSSSTASNGTAGASQAGQCIEQSRRVLESQVLRHDVIQTVDLSASDWVLGYQRVGDSFFGWGGWGDSRDQELCTYMLSMYSREAEAG